MPKLLIEGRPGTGKTTLARAVTRKLQDKGLSVGGFTTEEMRERGRVGFAVEAIGGERATLAHVDYPGPPKVGKYGVDLDTFEQIALPALQQNADIVIIDELGKMELASDTFKEAVEELIDSRTPVFATIHTFKHPFTDELKTRSDTHLLKITKANRDELIEEVMAALEL